jgi:hypothetical protein
MALVALGGAPPLEVSLSLAMPTAAEVSDAAKISAMLVAELL